MFDSPMQLMLGLLTGFLFGVLLQKGRVAKFEVIIGQFILRDWTVVKIMGTAVIVGAIGVYALVDMGHASLHIKPLLLAGILAGAVCFGVGMALFGYCPGTSVAACGEGRRDAMMGVVGMLVGAAAYVAALSETSAPNSQLGRCGRDHNSWCNAHLSLVMDRRAHCRRLRGLVDHERTCRGMGSCRLTPPTVDSTTASTSK